MIGHVTVNTLAIRIGGLDHPAVVNLLSEHLQSMALHSPPESIHALDLDALRQPAITFWSAWQGEQLKGCCALKQLAADHGEVKSMRTSNASRRQGVGAQMLRHLLAEALRRNYRRLSLETGAAQAFEPAHRLYASFGFSRCGPFGDYVEDPYSVFMTRDVTPADAAP